MTWSQGAIELAFIIVPIILIHLLIGRSARHEKNP